jgi:uncharacterized protein (TIGR02246 family)
VVSLERGNKADLAAIKGMLKQFATAINDGDLEGWTSLWADDGIQMFPGAPARIGKKQIREGMKPAFDQFILKMVITNKELQICGDLGFARGTYTESLVPKAGGKAEKYDGKYLTILEKQANGSWKVIRDCFNSNVPET